MIPPPIIITSGETNKQIFRHKWAKESATSLKISWLSIKFGKSSILRFKWFAKELFEQ